MFKNPNRAARWAGVCLLVLLWAAPVAAAGNPGPESFVKHSVLDNGLELFVNPNHAVPLATIMVSFRCGAISQQPETAGLFHLYEHLLFAGNASYRTQTEFMAALNRMGVANWNGGTSNEYVNYYITIPSDRLAEGLAFWAAAIRTPLFDPAQFEREKVVVTNEIKGYHADAADNFGNAILSRAFAAYPWRKDVSGPVKNIANASLEMMRQIQARFYIPNNAAILVGGDVDPAQVRALVQKHFGDWRRGPAPQGVAAPHPGFGKDQKLIFADKDFYNGVGLTQITWRGPDVLAQTKDTYVADVLLFLMSSPVGRFKQAIYGKVPGLYDAEHIGFGYPTQRDGGQFIFSSFFLYNPEQPADLLARQEMLREAVLAELALVAQDPAAYFGTDELELAKTKLSDQNLMGMETAGSTLSTLNFWWTTATTDYFFGYEANCKAVSFGDIAALVKRWIVGQPSLSAMRVRADAAANDPGLREQAAEFGYELVGPDNSYWWQRPAAGGAQ